MPVENLVDPMYSGNKIKRRIFLKFSLLALGPAISSSCRLKKKRFNIRIFSDMDFGHLLHEGHSFRSGTDIKTNTLIVGGGISGITAAYQLRQMDFILCELSNQLGGTSTAVQINGTYFSQGAHYDLAYPENYGKEGIELLKNLNIIRHNEFKHLWEFTESQYIINRKYESQSYEDGSIREDILRDNDTKKRFINLVQTFGNEMIMPTRLIKTEFHSLNDLTFAEFLKKSIQPEPSFVKGIDYHMRDDYGGTSDQVSALAGIHYFQCRPYYTKPIEVFSPPQGNYYFIQKLINKIPPERIKNGQLVYHLQRDSDGFMVKVLDRNSRKILNYHVKNVIYAGNKHTLKYTFPSDYPLFERISYAPWAIMNILLKEDIPGERFWQNEILSGHSSMIGFVDSGSQFTDPGTLRILTVYFCLDPASRIILADIENTKENFCAPVIELISEYFGVKLENLIEEIYIRIFGHAMPIPVPGFLFKDQNSARSFENFVYAGVDNHRLPLFFEALDSGIQAAKLINPKNS
jgi:protoporphyrinogen oxidase